MDDEHRAFREAVAGSRRVDPMPTFRNLAAFTGTEVGDVVHHALVRWVAAGAEALMGVDSLALRDLVAARRAEDWAKVAGIVDWIEAGMERQAAEDGAG
ncbi:MAG TPA: DUF6027 family protein [Candidatus Dormibacteraeota bacterium]|jgi:hypothetical protein|nr:DUF6027 family protein [Candidatus Dormibacteraeota bacterium]